MPWNQLIGSPFSAWLPVRLPTTWASFAHSCQSLIPSGRATACTFTCRSAARPTKTCSTMRAIRAAWACRKWPITSPPAFWRMAQPCAPSQRRRSTPTSALLWAIPCPGRPGHQPLSRLAPITARPWFEFRMAAWSSACRMLAATLTWSAQQSSRRDWTASTASWKSTRCATRTSTS
ncbi:hypothetical protein D9M71_118600 [compost metagenome]